MDQAEQFEGEYESWPDNGRRVEWKEQPSGCNRGWKRQKLTADDIDKQYLDALEQIDKRMQETSCDSDNVSTRLTSCNATSLSIAQQKRFDKNIISAVPEFQLIT
jgi:hypothetical protein